MSSDLASSSAPGGNGALPSASASPIGTLASGGNVPRSRRHAATLIPGVLLSVGVAALAMSLDALEVHTLGRAWLEGLVMAILLGTTIRSTFHPSARYAPGIAYSAKTVLEIAVVLLGASVSTQALAAAGLPLLSGIVLVVVLVIGMGYGLGRVLGLTHTLSILVACGNAICGNSAIAAIAPIVKADAKDVAASIAFTAVLGVAVVLTLPALSLLFGLSNTQFGIFAGLTVYAVPQVIAATAPVSALSVQVGTLVKLVRVLMLGPVLFGVSLVVSLVVSPVSARGGAKAARNERPRLSQLLPWFIVGFLLLMALRSCGAIPPVWVSHARGVSNLLTVVAMAALGLGVDVRTVASAGGRVTAAAALSLLLLAGMSLVAIHLLRIA